MDDDEKSFDWLAELVPIFYVDGSNIEVLREPAEFYSKLKVQLNLLT